MNLEPREIEALMIPRYIVKMNYPNSPFKVGQILPMTPPDNDWSVWTSRKKEVEAIRLDESVTIYTIKFSDYPEIFTELKWWEKRLEHELPKYLKTWMNSKPYIAEVVDFTHREFNIVRLKREATSIDADVYLKHWLPATEEEFLNRNK